MKTRLFLIPALLAAGAAGAHITVAEPSGRAGSYQAAFFRVTHGCDGSPTLSIRVEVPASVAIARPQPKAGWTLATEKAPLATPVRSESGATVRDRVSAITWTGRLEADQFDQFGVMLKLPDVPGPVYFPTVQRCVSGSTAWTTIPAAGQAWHSVPHPAPVLQVTEAEGGSGAMAGMRM